MEFHWDPKPADPIVNQRCCNRRGFLVPYGISFGPFTEVITDDHYVLITVLGHREKSTAILSKGEPTLYCCVGRLALVLSPLTAAQVVHLLHQLSTSSRQRTQ